jgi:hypothetical protein
MNSYELDSNSMLGQYRSSMLNYVDIASVLT